MKIITIYIPSLARLFTTPDVPDNIVVYPPSFRVTTASLRPLMQPLI